MSKAYKIATIPPMKNEPDSSTIVPKKRGRRIIVITALLGLLAILIWQFFPYQTVAEKQVKRIVANYGIGIDCLNIKRLTPYKAEINDIGVKGEYPLSLHNLSLTFSPDKVTKGKFQHVEAEALNATLYQKDNNWSLGGLETLSLPNKDPSTSLSPYFHQETLETTIPDQLTLKHIDFRVIAPHWKLNLPLSLNFLLKPQANLILRSIKPLSFEAGSYNITANNLQLSAVLNGNEKSWQGGLQIPALQATGFSKDLPPLILEGQLLATEKQLRTTLFMYDKTKLYNIRTALTLPLGNLDEGIIDITSLNFPWGGGSIGIKTTIPLTLKKPVPVTLNLKNVDLASLMDALSKGEIKASGKVTGALPILYHPDGSITLKPGAAEALSAGTISVPPSLLPGENSSLALARDALKDFRYTTLKITVSSSGMDKPTVTLTIAGNNPDVLEGREIKLTVNLSGDILPLIQQSLIPFNDVKQMLDIQDTP